MDRTDPRYLDSFDDVDTVANVTRLEPAVNPFEVEE